MLVTLKLWDLIWLWTLDFGTQEIELWNLENFSKTSNFLKINREALSHPPTQKIQTVRNQNSLLNEKIKTKIQNIKIQKEMNKTFLLRIMII